VIFGGDFNTITRSKDRRDFRDKLGYDSLFLNAIVREAGLVMFLDFCYSKSEWWELVKQQTVGLFKAIGRRKQQDKYITYQRLRWKLDRPVSNEGYSGAISEVKLLLRRHQYDRHASLVQERDYGKYHSPDPYQNCKQSVAVKTVSGLKDNTGSLMKSRSWRLSGHTMPISWEEGTLIGQGCWVFLESTPGLESNVPLMNLTYEITADE
ncbi:hypothetical protein AB205_0020320, partial [Aquarana catesbeiana]